MQLPSIDRIQNFRPLAVEAASLVTGKVLPVAPVNPSTQNASPAEPSPSVINMINQSEKPNAGEGVYTSVADPSRAGAAASSTDKDWTIRRPAPEKVENPPPPPISKMLMEYTKTLWVASASAVQVQQQVKNQLDGTQPNLNATPGVLSSQSLTYSPSKVNKTENI